MSKVVPAGKQLVKQLLDKRPDAVFEWGEPDGLGFRRTLILDPPTTRSLGKALRIVADHDPRISDVESRNKRLRITFVADVRADRAYPFEIDEVQSVLDSK